MAALSLARLTGRKLIKLKGPDCYPYLQGLICNDLRYIYEKFRIPERKNAVNTTNVMSTFMLNAQGRIICDMIIYRTPFTREVCDFSPPGQAVEPDELLIECDASLANGLSNTLFGYRVRRKVSLSIEDDMSVWCLYPSFADSSPANLGIASNELMKVDGLNQDETITDDFTLVRDPRLAAMGLRILTKSNKSGDVLRVLQSMTNVPITESTYKNYVGYRYFLGVGEGLQDHPESSCLPLESNADYLGSVSFTKGCYLGQELTARIFYTGVVRKRLMPIQINLDTFNEKTPLIDGLHIVNESEKRIGNLRSVHKGRGLALIRHDLLKQSQKLIIKEASTEITAQFPFWWPSKELVSKVV